MTLGINSVSIYTVKFTGELGGVQLEDFPASGVGDAEDKWREKYAAEIGAGKLTLVNIFRKQ